MSLNLPQVAFVRTSRQMIEYLIRVRTRLDAYVLDYDNQQVALPTDATVLDDSADGSTPRDDAPQLTGANVQSLRNFSAGMRDQINEVALDSLVELAVRDVNTIISGA